MGLEHRFKYIFEKVKRRWYNRIYVDFIFHKMKAEGWETRVVSVEYPYWESY